METITGEQFEELIYSKNLDLLSNYIVKLEKVLNINLRKVSLYVEFKDLTFEGSELLFTDTRLEKENLHNLLFKHCQFYCDLTFSDIYVDEIKFSNCSFGNITLIDININQFWFSEFNYINKGDLKINKCLFNNDFDVNNLKLQDGKIIIFKSNFNTNFLFVNSEINQITISNCKLGENFEYFGNKSLTRSDSAFFNHCEFMNSSFFESKFNSDTKFSECKFIGVSKFEKIGDEIYSKVSFINCDFDKSTIFNDSRVHKIEFDNVKFNGIASFQNTYFDIVKIDRTIFEKGGLFDDIQIKNIDTCDRRTIRTIKLQLQKAENKIDFNRFRVYEFNAYQKDIKKKLLNYNNDKDRFYHRKREPIQLKRDLLILRINEFVSEYGTDWKRALKFTILSGLMFYSILYRIENSGSLNLEKTNEFFVGLFRFFLVTDFYNPLLIDVPREYLKNGLSWLIFILGKIFIAFGIYEMIQSFRKFKA